MSGLPVGPPVPGWTPRALPRAEVLSGRHVRLEPLSARRHAGQLFAALAGDDAAWTYMSSGPFLNAEAFAVWAGAREGRQDPAFFAILDADGLAGMAALHRIVPEHGCAEIGHIVFAPRLRRTTGATEALVLLMRWVFEAHGYRRLEWKCDALNAASRRAAERLGFAFEGVFRQHLVVKGRNRDTAWYAMTDADWRRLAPGYAAWLAEAGDGPQGRPLAQVLVGKA